MYGKNVLFTMLCVVIVCIGVSTVHSKNVTFELKSQNVATYSVDENNLGTVYVFEVPIPKEIIGKRLDSVLLEFYVDVSLKETAEIQHSPIIEVLLLTESFSGEGAPKFLENSSAVRNLRVGDDRKVQMDITDLVKSWLANPSTNHGLVIGSLTGLKDGNFTLRGDTLADGNVARITFFYQNRSGGRVTH